MEFFISIIAIFFILYAMIRKAVEHGTLDALLEFEKIKQQGKLNGGAREERARSKSHTQQLVEAYRKREECHQEDQDGESGDRE